MNDYLLLVAGIAAFFALSIVLEKLQYAVKRRWYRNKLRYQNKPRTPLLYRDFSSVWDHVAKRGIR